MRLIKFRAWDKSLSKMLYFDLDGYAADQDGEYGDLDIDLKGRFTRDNQPQPLMQFTGLLDKNGKEIYEGDILQFSDKWEWHRGKFAGGFLASKEDREEVKNDHVKYPYERRTIELPQNYEWLLSSEIQFYWEVIGNIYENPELLQSEPKASAA